MEYGIRHGIFKFTNKNEEDVHQENVFTSFLINPSAKVLSALADNGVKVEKLQKFDNDPFSPFGFGTRDWGKIFIAGSPFLIHGGCRLPCGCTLLDLNLWESVGGWQLEKGWRCEKHASL